MDDTSVAKLRRDDRRLEELQQLVSKTQVALGLVGPHDADMTDAQREALRQRHEGEYAIKGDGR